MRVNKTDVPAVRTEVSPSIAVTTPKKPSSPAQDSPAAQVAITVSHAQKAAGAGHASRLRDIENAVRLGTYKPDVGRIAEEILASAELDARLRTTLIP